jgi:hypothetical protein
MITEKTVKVFVGYFLGGIASTSIEIINQPEKLYANQSCN